MTPLESLIHREITLNGAMPFDRFMYLALYTEDMGYYMSESTAIGRKGDFYTSSSLHHLFAVMIARQVEEMWQILDRPTNLAFIECGGGMGFFAKDFLDYVSQKPLNRVLRYIIIEKNPHLQKRQSALLSEQKEKIIWIRDIEELNETKGIIFCNELFDAFPVRIVQKVDKGIYEVWLNVKDGKIVEEHYPCRQDTMEYINDFCPQITDDRFDDCYRTEINLSAKEWLQKAYRALGEGFIITIDYGYNSDDYYRPDRHTGTLLCYYRHEINENPYINIGRQDITAHVNFSSLKKWGSDIGLRNCGFCSQGSYLVSLGIDKAILEMYGESPDPFQIAKIKGLILPQGLGQSHKVLIQYKGGREFALKGFDMSNRLGYL
ncbi:MAG: SAM-dependent methyltransferase [Thermodesulfovibrionales bacterium]